MTPDNGESLEGRWALVTGAARRIGAVIAEALHDAGAGVIIHYFNSAEPADALADRLNGRRAGSALTVQCDLRETSGLEAHVIEGRGPQRTSRCPGQQCLELLPDAGRLDHRRSVARPHRHQPEGAAVSLPGGPAAPAQDRRHDRQHCRCSLAAAAEESPRIWGPQRPDWPC